MQNILRKLLLVGVLTSTFTGGAVFAQTPDNSGSGNIVTLTNQNEGYVENAASYVPILAAIGSPSFYRAHRAELTELAAAHKNSLLVVYADPSTIRNADQIVAALTNGDTNYPMILFIGEETHKLKGTITQGEITTLVNAELHR